MKYLNLESCNIQTQGIMKINFEDKLYNGLETMIE